MSIQKNIPILCYHFSMTYEPLQNHQAKELKNVALKSWLFTYKDIYSKDFIKNFIVENYSEEAITNALKWAEENSGWSYIAKDGDKIVGYITIGPQENTWRLWRIYLLPEYIGKGIGNKLLELGEEFLKKQQTSNYFVFVHKNNQIGKGFYLKKGFEHIPEKDNDEEWYMEKPLQ